MGLLEQEKYFRFVVDFMSSSSSSSQQITFSKLAYFSGERTNLTGEGDAEDR